MGLALTFSIETSLVQGYNQKMRQLCVRCLRSEKVCLCAQYEALEVRQQYIILQHPKERKNPVGTGRMTSLLIQNAKLWEGVDFSQDPRVERLLLDPEFYPVVLYPGRDACNLSDPQSAQNLLEKKGQKKLAIFIIDGTWAGAKKMMKLSTNLHSLPKISFTSSTPSAYQIRQQPLAECLSTLESTVVLMEELKKSELEPKELAAQRLTQAFLQMIATQLEFKKNPDLNRHRLNHIRRPKSEVKAPPPKKRSRPRPLFFMKRNYALDLEKLKAQGLTHFAPLDHF